MLLLLLIGLPLLGGLLAWILAPAGKAAPRWISLGTLLGMAAIALSLANGLPSAPENRVEWIAPWIPQLGISLALFIDGLSLPLVLLSIVISLLAVLVSWNTIEERVGAFHFNLLWVLSGSIGVFLAADLFLFFFFWELMVVPMAFLIAFWGGANREAAATKFFIFTQFSGLLMLIATIGLALLRAEVPGLELSFLYWDLLESPLRAPHILMLGFFIAFAVKLPIAPFHTWQADAYTSAPTGATLVLAGFLSKTGGYGLLRFCIPLFPEASQAFIPWAFAFGAFTVIYGAMLAYGQNDAKRLVAFSSLGHMGFILAGGFAGSPLGMQGTLIYMLSHGLATGALFILVDAMERRTGHRNLDRIGGVAAVAPRFAGITMFFILISLGLPAGGNFVGEFLILIAAFQQHPLLGAILTIGILFPAVYSLYFIQKALHGKTPDDLRFPELNSREYLTLALMAVALLYLGLRPQGIINSAEPAFATIARQVQDSIQTADPLLAEASTK